MKRFPPERVRKYYFAFLLTGGLIGFAGAAGKTTLLSVMGVTILFIDILFYALLYRCPHCGKHLDRSAGAFCPYCGKKLRE